MSHLFISYSKKDIEFVRYLRALLHAEGFDVWFDDELTPGDDWWEMLEQQIRGCAAFLVVMTPEAKTSRWVQRELLLAENRNLPIFPVLLSGEMWTNLADLQYADMRRGLHASLPAKLLQSLKAIIDPQPKSVLMTIQQGDILWYEADVVAFKYARSFHGADQIAAAALSTVGITEEAISPDENEFAFVETKNALTAAHALYVGLPRLGTVGYEGVRKLAADTLRILADIAPETRHLAMTLHGPGFGLDESEAFISQFTGFLDAFAKGKYPPHLEQISIVEFREARVDRLRTVMEAHLRGESYAQSEEDGYRITISKTETSKSSKKKLPAKTHAYVIMSPQIDEDIFFYGIQTPVHAHGLLCERVDGQELTDETVNQIMERIETASVVIADLSIPDAKIYWQLGYALGKERPLILLTNSTNELLFPNFSAVSYSKIREVEAALIHQLAEFKTSGTI